MDHLRSALMKPAFCKWGWGHRKQENAVEEKSKDRKKAVSQKWCMNTCSLKASCSESIKAGDLGLQLIIFVIWSVGQSWMVQGCCCCRGNQWPNQSDCPLKDYFHFSSNSLSTLGATSIHTWSRSGNMSLFIVNSKIIVLKLYRPQHTQHLSI